jgi:hypothetical protein
MLLTFHVSLMKCDFFDELLRHRDGKNLISRKIEMLKRPQPTNETKIEIRQGLQSLEENDEFNDWCKEQKIIRHRNYHSLLESGAMKPHREFLSQFKSLVGAL